MHACCTHLGLLAGVQIAGTHRCQRVREGEWATNCCHKRPAHRARARQPGAGAVCEPHGENSQADDVQVWPWCLGLRRPAALQAKLVPHQAWGAVRQEQRAKNYSLRLRGSLSVAAGAERAAGGGGEFLWRAK